MSENGRNTDHPTEVSVEIGATKTGYSAKIRSRTIAAIDQLFGGLINFLGRPIANNNSIADAETAAFIKELEARSEARAAVIKAAGEKLASDVKSDATRADQILNQRLTIESRKQENIESVAIETLREIEQLKHDERNDETTDILDVDWLNYFRGFAENASTESMRQIFGKILAGELVRPGSFSRRTIRTVFEIDQNVAIDFQKCAPFRFGTSMPLSIPHFNLGNFLELEEAGLITGTTGMLTLTLHPLVDQPEGNVCAVGDNYILVGQEKPQRYGLKTPLAIAVLTKTGKQLAELFPQNELTAIQLLVNEAKDRFLKVAAYRIITRTGENIQWAKTPEKILHSEDIIEFE